MIDPGEAILSVIGVRHVVLREPKKMMATDWRDVTEIEDRISRDAKSLVGGKALSCVYTRVPVGANYDEWLAALTESPTHQEILRMVEGFPDEAHEEVSDFLRSASVEYTYLMGLMPHVIRPMLLSLKSLKPADLLIGVFESIVSILDRPLRCFSLIQQNRLQHRQVEALRAVYPSLYIAYGEALYKAVSARIAREPSWVPEWSQGLATYLGVEDISVGLKAALSSATEETRAMQQAREAGKQERRNSKAADMTAAGSRKPELGADQ